MKVETQNQLTAQTKHFIGVKFHLLKEGKQSA